MNNKTVLTTTLVLAATLLSASLASSAAQAAQCTATVTQKFSDPTQNGLRIDKCVQGAGWGLLDPKRCDSTRRKNAANAFCQSKQFSSAKSYRLRPHVGNHSIWTFPKGSNPNNGFWTQTPGLEAFQEIICQKQVVTNNCKETRRFSNPTERGLRIDNCVQGAGWGFADPKRCDSTRRKNAADAFCRTKQYRSAVSSKINTDIGHHSIWTFAKGSNPANGSWTQTAGLNAFKEIVCERPK